MTVPEPTVVGNAVVATAATEPAASTEPAKSVPLIVAKPPIIEFVPATAAVNLIAPEPGVKLRVAPAARVPSKPKVSAVPAVIVTLPAPAVGVSAPIEREPAAALYWKVPPASCQPVQPVDWLVLAVKVRPPVMVVVVALAYCSVPPETTKPPVKVLLPLSTQVPVPVLPMVSAPVLSAMTEEIVLASVLAPPR